VTTVWQFVANRAYPVSREHSTTSRRRAESHASRDVVCDGSVWSRACPLRNRNSPRGRTIGIRAEQPKTFPRPDTPHTRWEFSAVESPLWSIPLNVHTLRPYVPPVPHSYVAHPKAVVSFVKISHGVHMTERSTRHCERTARNLSSTWSARF